MQRQRGSTSPDNRWVVRALFLLIIMDLLVVPLTISRLLLIGPQIFAPWLNWAFHILLILLNIAGAATVHYRLDRSWRRWPQRIVPDIQEAMVLFLIIKMSLIAIFGSGDVAMLRTATATYHLLARPAPESTFISLWTCPGIRIICVKVYYDSLYAYQPETYDLKVDASEEQITVYTDRKLVFTYLP